MANPVITNIEGYINVTKLGLIGKVFNGADSMEYLNKQSGIKGATQLTLLDTTVQFADGTVCGWNPTGADTFSKRVIEPALIKVQKAWCPDVLFKTWMNEQLNYAAGGTEMTDAQIAEVVVGQQITEVSKALEKAIWQGKKATDLFDGLATIIKKESSAVKTTYAAGATVSSIVDDVISKLPEDAYSMGDVVIYMGKDMYRKYLQELRANGNLVLNMAYDDLRAPKSVIAPLSDVRVIGVSGLNATGEVYASFANNFIYGTDLIDGPEKVSFKESEDESYHLSIKFVAGTQVAFPALIVYAVQA